MCVFGMCVEFYIFVFFFKQKTAYEMRISDWSSDVCSSDLAPLVLFQQVDRLFYLLHLFTRDRLEVFGVEVSGADVQNPLLNICLDESRVVERLADRL